jgi:hypothetical protein
MKNQELRKTAKNLAVDASNVASITKGYYWWLFN